MSDSSLDLSWAGAIKRLRHYCPTSLPVQVRRARLDDANGTCWRTKNHYKIEVDANLTHDHALLILTHEWAHAMVWPLELEWGNDHTAHFGIAWTRSYNSIYDPRAL